MGHGQAIKPPRSILFPLKYQVPMVSVLLTKRNLTGGSHGTCMKLLFSELKASA